jgi:hypothetical protein
LKKGTGTDGRRKEHRKEKKLDRRNYGKRRRKEKEKKEIWDKKKRKRAQKDKYKKEKELRKEQDVLGDLIYYYYLLKLQMGFNPVAVVQ